MQCVAVRDAVCCSVSMGNQLRDAVRDAVCCSVSVGNGLRDAVCCSA